MKKQELDEMLKSVGIPVNEGVTSMENSCKYPRIVYWDYVLQDESASGEAYVTNVTYQISHFSKKPRDKSLIQLMQIMRKNGLFPQIYVEYVKEDRVFHSYFSIEVTEEIKESDAI